MRYYFLLLLLTAGWLAGNCQDNKTGKVQYSGMYEVGMLIGKAYTKVNPQIIQGISFKNYFTGIGVALDPYGFRTVPVFAQFRYSLHNDRSSPFAFASLGVSLPWNNDAIPEKFYNSDETWHKLKTGPYSEIGIGYKVKLDDGHAMNLMIGYCYKRFEYTEKTSYYTDQLQQYEDRYVYDYRRISLRVGFQF